MTLRENKWVRRGVVETRLTRGDLKLKGRGGDWIARIDECKWLRWSQEISSKSLRFRE